MRVDEEKRRKKKEKVYRWMDLRLGSGQTKKKEKPATFVMVQRQKRWVAGADVTLKKLGHSKRLLEKRRKQWIAKALGHVQLFGMSQSDAGLAHHQAEKHDCP